jgi:DNA-binding MarR family transcriptional regulator
MNDIQQQTPGATASARTVQIESLFSSLNQLRRVSFATADHSLKQYGISFAQATILKAVKDHECGGIKDIAEACKTTSSAATQLVNVLVEKEYLAREHRPDDHRAVRITLSEKGRMQLDSMESNVLKNLFDMFTDTELAAYAQATREFIQRMQVEKNQKS